MFIKINMTGTNLNYEAIYDILRRERSRQELQKLDQTFYNEVSSYIKDKEDVLESQKQKSSIFAQKEIEKTEKQLENVKKIIKELYEKRELKIIQLAISFARARNMQETPELLPEEKIMFNNVVKILKDSRENSLNEVLHNKPKVIKTVQETKLVRFIQAVPKFVTEDLKEYGPFEEEYIASLPNKVADLLIKNEKVELV